MIQKCLKNRVHKMGGGMGVGEWLHRTSKSIISTMQLYDFSLHLHSLNCSHCSSLPVCVCELFVSFVFMCFQLLFYNINFIIFSLYWVWGGGGIFECTYCFVLFGFSFCPCFVLFSLNLYGFCVFVYV